MKPEKNKLWFGIFLLLTLLWMAAIFGFSAKPAEESSKMSHKTGMLISRMFVPGFDDWSEERQNELADKIDHPVRKTAHATEYCILGMLCMGVFLSSGWKRKAPDKMAVAVLTGALYAASDEIHQLFVPGRAGRVTDVLIDTAGVAAGVLIAYGIWRMAGRKTVSSREKKPKNKEAGKNEQ